MPHIHTESNQYDFTVTMYIVRVDRDMPMALLHQHKKHNIYLPVGGHVETNETPWKAVFHELREESGYDLDQMKVLQPPSRIQRLDGVIQHPYPVSMNSHVITEDHFHTDISYALVASSDPRHKIDSGESEDVRWFSRKDIEKIEKGMIFENTRQVYMFILDEALNTWEAIPTDNFSYNEKTPPL
jgi:8-oxo-dGTP diphosphatase